MIKMVNTLVAEFAMHRLFGYSHVANPAMFGRLCGIDFDGWFSLSPCIFMVCIVGMMMMIALLLSFLLK